MLASCYLSNHAVGQRVLVEIHQSAQEIRVCHHLARERGSNKITMPPSKNSPAWHFSMKYQQGKIFEEWQRIRKHVEWSVFDCCYGCKVEHPRYQMGFGERSDLGNVIPSNLFQCFHSCVEDRKSCCQTLFRLLRNLVLDLRNQKLITSSFWTRISASEN